MGLNLCPVATVAAPVEEVWELLTRPSRYDEWWDARTERIVPEGPATAGQRVYASSSALGRRWQVTLVFEMIDPDKHQIRLKVGFPLGISVLETLTCTAIDVTTCRVQYG